MRTALLFIVIPLSSCTTTTDVIATDLTKQSGVYVIGYIDRDDIRRGVEDRLYFWTGTSWSFNIDNQGGAIIATGRV